VPALTGVRLAAALLVLAACGGSRRPARSNVETGEGYDHRRTGDPSSAADAGVAFTGTRPLACAPSYADLRGACDPTVSDQTCSYTEGVCYCGIDYPCSGVRIPDEQLARLPNQWQCTPTPPAVRPDGCPGVMPGADVACAPDGKVCSWGDCCFHQMTCTAGTWVRTGGGCPP
jgi:hypothetical protein